METAGYIKLYESGELANRITSLQEIMSSCSLCPRNCRVDRRTQKGWCKTGIRAKLSSYGAHFGEEPPLVGYSGSGTIFFAYCNLGCVFCQNYDISSYGRGYEVSKEELADIMLGLQKKGCHNINFVSPSHVVPQIVEALPVAIEAGLKVPLVYNTGGYDALETIRLLNGIMDIYMPDMKYSDNQMGAKLSCVPDYWNVNKSAVKLMYQQVGDLQIINGIAKRGLLVRHLILPENLAGSEKVFTFLAEEVSKNTYLNIMDQYHPDFKSGQITELTRRITKKEHDKVIELAENLGLNRLC